MTQDINKYEILVGGADPIGEDFLNNVIALAAKGATRKAGEAAILRFPHSVKMVYETTEELESTPCHVVFPISEPRKEREAAKLAAKLEAEANKIKSKAELREEKRLWLEAMEWEEFKKEVNDKGVKGRDRQTMQNLYLKAFE